MQSGFITPKQVREIPIPVPLGKGVGVAAIKIELPEVKKDSSEYLYTLIVKNKKGKQVKKMPFGLVGPFSEIAWETMDSKIA